MKQIFTSLILIFSTYIIAQTKIDTIANGIIVENDFSKQAEIRKEIIQSSSTSENEFDYETPFNKKSEYESWAIKAKVLPWISPLGSGSGYNPSCGFEFGFLKNHSVGVDLTYNQYSFSSGDVKDTVTNNYEPGPRVKNYDRALILSYRYYLNFNKLRAKEGIAFYTGTFFRAGKLSYGYDEGYNRDRSTLRENHLSGGIIFGILKEIHQFDKIDNPLYLDVYIAPFIKQKEITSEHLNEYHQLIEKTDFSINYGLRVGLTLSMNFSRKSLIKHKAKSYEQQ